MTMTFRSLYFGLFASTALATPAMAQDTQPQTTGQSPAPGTNATDVTAPPPKVQTRQDGYEPDPTEIVTSEPSSAVTIQLSRARSGVPSLLLPNRSAARPSS